MKGRTRDVHRYHPTGHVMTRDEFLAKVTEYRKLNPRQRPGQATFNCAYMYAPDVKFAAAADATRGRYGVDPFHQDGFIPAFLDALPFTEVS